MEEIQLKLEKINNKLEKINNEVANDCIIHINSLLDDIINELDYNDDLQKKNVNDQSIIKINKYEYDKQFINNIFPLFHYLYENTLETN